MALVPTPTLPVKAAGGGQCGALEHDARWHHGHTLAAGQVAEFKVWAELTRQSLGGLHVFLPLRDLGVESMLT